MLRRALALSSPALTAARSAVLLSRSATPPALLAEKSKSALLRAGRLLSAPTAEAWVARRRMTTDVAAATAHATASAAATASRAATDAAKEARAKLVNAPPATAPPSPHSHSPPHGHSAPAHAGAAHADHDDHDHDHDHAPSPSTSAQPESRFRRMWRKYGVVFLGTYLTVYLTTLGTMFELAHLDYISAKSAIDTLTRWGLDNYVDMALLDGKAGSFALAWILTKFTEPPRLAVSVLITPQVARWVGRVPPKPPRAARAPPPPSPPSPPSPPPSSPSASA